MDLMDNKYNQSSVVPFRIVDKKFQILLIASLNSGQWIFPKGIIDDGLSAREAGALEAWEEAGVRGKVAEVLLGIYEYKKWGGICHVEVFPMKVTEILDDWPESGERKRCWVSLKKARRMVKKKELCLMLDNLEKNQESLAKAIE